MAPLGLFNGMTLVQNMHHPVEHYATNVHILEHHWVWLKVYDLIERLGFARNVRRHDVIRGRALYRDKPLFVMGNRIFCSPRQYQTIRQELSP